MANNKDFKVKNGIKVDSYREGFGTIATEDVAYSLASIAYSGKNVSTTATVSSVSGLAFKPDGTKLYVVSYTNGIAYQYSLSTAWDTSTASYDSISKDLSAQDLNGFAVAFKPDGTKMYYIGFNDIIYQYSLSPAWDITSASYDSVSYSVNAIDAITRNMFFGADGTKLYTVGDSNNSIYQHTLGTAWDLSTASSDSVSVSVASQETVPSAVTFNADGTIMLVIGTITDSVHQYNLTTAWDLSTASYSGASFILSDLGPTIATPSGLFWGDNGNSLYVTNQSGTFIAQYSTTLITNNLDLSTGSVFEINANTDFKIGLSNPAASGTVSGATLILNGYDYGYNLINASYDYLNFSATAQSPNTKAFTMGADGMSLYVGDYDTDSIYQYTLSTAWDVSTASYASKSLDVSTQGGSIIDLAFKPDGTIMYMLDLVTDSIYQYDLSTPWDLATASYANSSYATTAVASVPYAFFIKSDGTKLYVLNQQVPDTVYQFSLSTAWDISTATYDSVSLEVQNVETIPWDIEFDNTGTKMFIIGRDTDRVHQYNLTTAWDLSTAFYSYIAFSVAAQNVNISGLHFKPDGAKMYMLDDQFDTIWQYTTYTESTITYDASIQWNEGTTPNPPTLGETDVLIFSTRDGGTTYNAALAIDGAQ